MLAIEDRINYIEKIISQNQLGLATFLVSLSNKTVLHIKILRLSILQTPLNTSLTAILIYLPDAQFHLKILMV